jgi:4-amino-4-deoxy-L-arabinose transferase-like glycosyltransferase
VTARDAGASTPAWKWWVLGAVALMLRAAYVWLAAGPHGVPPNSDPASYDEVAWNLARGVGFCFGTPEAHFPTAFVAPALPWMVSLLYRAVGHGYFAALLLQCLLGACVPLVVVALGRRLFGARAGWIAGWLVAVHPLLVFFTGYLVTETALTLGLYASLLAVAWWVGRPGRGRALVAGVCLGLTALIKPSVLPLPVVLLPWAWWGLRGVPRAARAGQVLLFAVGMLAAVGPWTLRNALTLHAFVPVTTAGRTFFDSNNPLVWSDPALRGNAISMLQVEPYAAEFRHLDEVQADRRGRELALRFLGAHVREWPAAAAAKLRRFWRLSAESRGFWQRPGSPLTPFLGYVDPLLLWSVLTWPLGLVGLVAGLRARDRRPALLSALLILYFMALAAVFWGALRMRLPIEPLLMLLAGAGAARILPPRLT